jgi:hypothetical protein
MMSFLPMKSEGLTFSLPPIDCTVLISQLLPRSLLTRYAVILIILPSLFIIKSIQQSVSMGINDWVRDTHSIDDFILTSL